MVTAVRTPTGTGLPRAVGLDVLRSTAALGVLVTHVAFATGVVNPERIGSSLRLVLPRLDVGVSIFFVLSGLLVSRPFVKAVLRDEPSPDLRTYARRRLSRIYPLYWVALAATLILATGPGPSLPELLADVALVHIYRPSTAIGPITQSWSLATEVAFYAFLPLWFIGCRRWWAARGVTDPGARRRLLVAGFASWIPLSLLWRLLVVAITDTHDFTDPSAVDTRGALLTWLPNHLDTFAVGALMAVWLESGRARTFRPAERIGCYVVGLGSLWLASAHLGLPPLFTGFDGPQTLARHALFVICAGALVAPSVAALTARDASRTASTARVRMGTWVKGAALASYGVYLWHQLVTEQWFERRGLAEFVTPFPTTVLAVAAISTAIAACTYWAVERPAGDLFTGRLGRDSSSPVGLGRHAELDGLRGLAVLAVLGTHIVFLAGGDDRWALRGGFLGVDVFLVLSGFLIGSVLMATVERRGSVEGATFARRRAFRLVPALVVFLVVQAVVAVWLGSSVGVQAEQAAFALTFTANWQLSFGIQPPFELVHLWSLSLEAQFYVLLALLVWAVRHRLDRSRSLVAALLLASVLVALWRLQLYSWGLDPIAVYERTDARADSMLIGLAAAVAWRAGLVSRRTLRRLAPGAAAFLAVCAVVATPESAWLFEGGFTVVAAAAAALVLAAASGTDATARVTRLRGLRWFGMISYSLYLWHLPVFIWVARAMPDAQVWMLVAVAFPAATAAGWLSFQLVERRSLATWRTTTAAEPSEQARSPR